MPYTRLVKPAFPQPDGSVIYLLPCIPADGTYQPERVTTLEMITEGVGFIKEKLPSDEQKEARMSRTRQLLGAYAGRFADTGTVLEAAAEQGRFDYIAKKLEDQLPEIARIPPRLRLARTDVDAFFIGLYLELRLLPEEEVSEAQRTIELVREYGPGLRLTPRVPVAIAALLSSQERVYGLS
ncbi:MAG: hypothetical protein AABX70_07810 [Nanoarchaeota archaeon]